MLNASKHEARPKISSPNPLRRIRRAVEDYDFDRLEVEAQQCVKLTSTNRPFGLIIKLSQSVFEEAQRMRYRLFCTLLSHSRFFARDELRNPFASFEFPVVIPRGSHPFPSRTRKLSLAGPMILHGQLCGNVGHRRD